MNFVKRINTLSTVVHFLDITYEEMKGTATTEKKNFFHSIKRKDFKLRAALHKLTTK